ncbi:MAG: 2-C-methyl-D-erythritol 4-phosphate cytidylyltransferase, partial [Hafnia sp.]
MSAPDESPLFSVVAVVPAAGVGSRMRSTCPKQYLSIDGKTILEHSV